MSNLSTPRQLAAEILDRVEEGIRAEHPDINQKAAEIVVDGEKVNTLLHGDRYYGLENVITEKIEELAIVFRDDLKRVLEDLLNREPTDAEIDAFYAYLTADTEGWIKGNAKKFIVDKIVRGVCSKCKLEGDFLILGSPANFKGQKCSHCGAELDGYTCEGCGLVMNKGEDVKLPDGRHLCKACDRGERKFLERTKK